MKTNKNIKSKLQLNNKVKDKKNNIKKAFKEFEKKINKKDKNQNILNKKQKSPENIKAIDIIDLNSSEGSQEEIEEIPSKINLNNNNLKEQNQKYMN